MKTKTQTCRQIKTETKRVTELKKEKKERKKNDVSPLTWLYTGKDL